MKHANLTAPRSLLTRQIGVPGRLVGRGLLVGLLVAGVAAAQSGADFYKGLSQSSDYVLSIDGVDDPAGEVYISKRIPAFLGFSDKLSSPFLVIPRSQMVQTVHIMKVAKQQNGTVDLLADPILRNEGSFRLVGQDIQFQVEGHQVVMKEKPPLLGLQDLAGMKAYSTDYVRLAEAYAPVEAALAAIRDQGRKVEVRVYFGSWCPFCQQYVPRIMRVAEELEESDTVAFDFYGLPRQIRSDPVSQTMKIDGVPTGVVFVDGEEAGRIRSDQWRAPEVAINQILAQ